MIEGLRGVDMAIEIGAVVRVVNFQPQEWKICDLQSERDEKFLLDCYIGKVGTVKAIDYLDMPFLLAFSNGSKVPLREMRFFPCEVEEV